MTISNSFNRFYHKAVLIDLFRKSGTLKFYELIDTRTNEAFTIYKGEDFNTIDELKQLLKILNLNYEVNEDERNGKLSTRDINNKALLEHIEWVFKLAAENHIELDTIKDEWDRLIKASR